MVCLRIPLPKKVDGRDHPIIQSPISVSRDIKSRPRNTRAQGVRNTSSEASELTRRRSDLRVISARYVTQYTSLRTGTLIPYSPRPETPSVPRWLSLGDPGEETGRGDRASVTGMSRRSCPLRFARHPRRDDLVGSSRRRSFPPPYFPIEDIIYERMRSERSNDRKFRFFFFYIRSPLYLLYMSRIYTCVLSRRWMVRHSEGVFFFFFTGEMRSAFVLSVKNKYYDFKCLPCVIS